MTRIPIGDDVETKPVARRWLWWVCFVSAWGTIVALLVIAALRVFYHDGKFVLIWFNAFTSYVYLPAYACLAWAAWQRRWLLTLASAAVVVCHVMWLAPDFLRDRRFEAAAASAGISNTSPTVRIFFANVAESNVEYDAMLREIAAADPDVIVLVEYGWGWHRAFKAAPEMAPYKYGSGHLQSHIGSVNVFSRLPLKTEMQSWVNGRALHTIDIQAGASTLRVVGLHAPRPIDGPKYDYRGYWQQMLSLLTAEQGPRVIVGDFNVTQHSDIYRQLTSGALQSAHEALGRGYAATWPNGRYLLPPIRIDHAFVSPEVECISISEGHGAGSDHKPLILDVRMRKPAAGTHEPGGRNAPGRQNQAETPATCLPGWIAGNGGSCCFVHSVTHFQEMCYATRVAGIFASSKKCGLRSRAAQPLHFRSFDRPFVEVFLEVATINFMG